ncbi:membrane progestin receptor gamma isoform X1 [Serinus canaria]|uniref:membrane progestin receptor gamma isoform X1 n=1 Tax=Serinus canaria TaxID=9135 RepID=UPI0021CCED7A|nr:membrane progestin receptor gamma isoform X1 [Serinus canaria]
MGCHLQRGGLGEIPALPVPHPCTPELGNGLEQLRPQIIWDRPGIWNSGNEEKSQILPLEEPHWDHEAIPGYSHSPPAPLECCLFQRFPALPDVPSRSSELSPGGGGGIPGEFQGIPGWGAEGPAVLPGSALAYSAYAFPLEWVGSTFHDFYVPVAVLNSVLSTGLSCYSRFLEAERPRLSKAFRTLAFVYPYIFDSIPVFYRLSRSAAGSCSEGSLPLHSRHSLCALLTFLSFTSHLPERLAPGSFDFIGHSHQVFHVCGILGTLFQLEAVSVDMAERRGRLPLPSSLETFGSLGMGAAGSLAILGLCFRSLRPEPPSQEKSH